MSDRGNSFWDEMDEYWMYNQIQKDLEEEDKEFWIEFWEDFNEDFPEENPELEDDFEVVSAQDDEPEWYRKSMAENLAPDPEAQEAPVEDGPEVSEFLESMNEEKAPEIPKELMGKPSSDSSNQEYIVRFIIGLLVIVGIIIGIVAFSRSARDVHEELERAQYRNRIVITYVEGNN